MSEQTVEAPHSHSPETQELIELCLAVHQGSEEMHDDLSEKAEVRLEQMNQAMDSFFGQVDAQGPEYYQELRRHFDEIEVHFRAYGEALEQVLEQRDSTDYLAVAQSLATASEGLRVCMAMYEEAELSRGPSSFPLINLFDNIAAARREGESSHEAWLQTCQRYKDQYAGALEEIEGSDAQDARGIPERKTALVEILGCLDELHKLDPTGPKSRLDEILSRLSAGFVDLGAAFDTYHEAQFSEGPTKGPKLNWIIKAAEGVLDGKYEPQVLHAMASEVLEETQDSLKELRALSKDKINSETLTEELSRMLESMESVEDTLAFLVDFAEGEAYEPEQVREAIEELIEAGDMLVEATEHVQEFGENVGKVTCVQCGATQEKGTRTCVSCGAQLPQQPGEGVYTHSESSSFQVLEGNVDDVTRNEIMTDVMKALFDKCEAFMKGDMDYDTFTMALQKSMNDVDEAEEKLSALASPGMPPEANQEEQEIAQEFIDLADDALALLGLGCSECRYGLNKMAEGAENDDPQAIREGMKSYYDGTQKMWQVRRLDHYMTQYIEADDEEEVPIDTTESVQLSGDA